MTLFLVTLLFTVSWTVMPINEAVLCKQHTDLETAKARSFSASFRTAAAAAQLLLLRKGLQHMQSRNKVSNASYMKNPCVTDFIEGRHNPLPADDCFPEDGSSLVP